MDKICKFMAASGHCTNDDCTACGAPCYESLGAACDCRAEVETAQAEVVQGEVVEAAPAPTHDAGPKFTVHVSHRTVELPAAQALSVQFARVGKTAGAAVREMVVFGAMLEKIDDGLTRNRYNNSDKGATASLKSWLEANCPDINYQTAKSYQRAAEGVRVLAKMAADVPLLPLMGRETPADEALRKVREDVLGVIANSSLNVLRRAAMPAGNGLKGTHGVAPGRRALTAEENAAEAESSMRELTGKLGAWLRGPWFNMLAAQSQDDFVGILKHYISTAEELQRAAIR